MHREGAHDAWDTQESARNDARDMQERSTCWYKGIYRAGAHFDVRDVQGRAGQELAMMQEIHMN